ncbi:P-loop containing nucleoside triphosphate hydrolase protein [Mycena belliarum]|uniref:P-loop containing nucleoside triphosphate hydrolase protein n=1 Tax=Mycena belliarum TaxID=1033014 RepID=A0AAD6UEL2_9AGAR|nr:P-loop containing nucleoside triphosphate hydrolase protein [Mycena belliae]
MAPTDDFVNIWGPGDVASGNNDFHRLWSADVASGTHPQPALQAANALRKIYPDHSLVMTQHNILNFPLLVSTPLPNAPLVASLEVRPTARTADGVTGILAPIIEFGAFQAAWDRYDFIIYVISWKQGFGTYTLYIVLHQGPEEASRSLILSSGLFNQTLHEEVWVYNQGFWSKDHPLWLDIQKADWKDVILSDDFKKTLQKDIYGFFKSEPIYKELAIPWKRGIIMHGPPGNGKTISIKVIMKTCDALGFAPLYVKSFQSYKGEEGAMQDVFDKARQMSPCVVVLEDLDALITDRNRSFFLNQLDGLQGNDGLLVIGTTNHFERLDPGLSTRPSRFDRKYLFDDPNRDERALYAKYWQEKLKTNDGIEYPDALVEEVADKTEQFSFAYLKEAFVSCLVTLAGWEGDDKPTFGNALKAQIKTLRKQLDKMPLAAKRVDFRPLFDTLAEARSPPMSPQSPPGERDFRVLLDRLASERQRGSSMDMRALGERIEALVAEAQRALSERELVAVVAPSTT